MCFLCDFFPYPSHSRKTKAGRGKKSLSFLFLPSRLKNTQSSHRNLKGSRFKVPSMNINKFICFIYNLLLHQIKNEHHKLQCQLDKPYMNETEDSTAYNNYLQKFFKYVFQGDDSNYLTVFNILWKAR